MDLQMFSIIFLVAFLIILGVLALRAGFQSSKSKGAANEEFYLGGRKTPWFILAFAYVTASCSAGAFIGDVGVMSTIGFPYFWYLIAVVPAMVIPAVFLMRKMRLQAEGLGSLTIPEYLGDRYKSPNLRLIVSILIVICYLFVLVSQFKGSAILLQEFTGVNFTTGLFIITAIVCFFVIVGGLRSVAWTDFAQGIPMLIMAIVVLVVAFVAVGGFPGVESALMAINPDMVNVVEPGGKEALMNVPAILGNFIFWFIVFISQPYLCQNFLALPDVSRKTIGKFLILSLVLALIFNAFCLVGLPGRVLFPEVAGDYMSSAVVTNLLPAPLAAFAMVGFFCAVLTTATAILLTMGQSIGRDIYMRINKKGTPKQQVAITRVAVLVITLLIVFFNIINPPEFLSLFMYMGLGGIGSCIGIPLFASIVTDKATRLGAFASAISGPVVYVIVQMGFGENYLVACLYSIPVAVVMMLVVSKFTQNTSIKNIHMSDNAPKVLVDGEAESAT